MAQEVFSGGVNRMSRVERHSKGERTSKLNHRLGNTSSVSEFVAEIEEEESVSKLELSDNARFIIEKRYLRRDREGNPVEDAEGLFFRVAKAVAEGEQEEDREEYRKKYFEVMSTLKFLPNSPTLVNAGTGQGCLSACFVVSPFLRNSIKIKPSIIDSVFFRLPSSMRCRLSL